ncbi:MAG: hypothetical protein KTR32_21650 [Granulosicoccus sp.]|nr:hypothetical protein [Granulosicoccus sp.]
MSTTQYQCLNNGIQKLISLDYPGKKHLCEVSVTPVDGSRDVKWYANQDSEFCNIKLKELVGKFQTLWGYTCEGQKKPSSLLGLNLRHRRAVDLIIKDVSREGKDAGIPFTVTAAQAHATRLSDETLSALVVQLIMNAKDSDISKPIDRTYFIEDDGDQFRTRSVFSGLHNSLTIDDDQYRIDSATVDGINSAGEIAVTTVLSALSGNTDDSIRCTGTQTLRTAADGSWFPASEHLIECE